MWTMGRARSFHYQMLVVCSGRDVLLLHLCRVKYRLYAEIDAGPRRHLLVGDSSTDSEASRSRLCLDSVFESGCMYYADRATRTRAVSGGICHK